MMVVISEIHVDGLSDSIFVRDAVPPGLEDNTEAKTTMLERSVKEALADLAPEYQGRSWSVVSSQTEVWDVSSGEAHLEGIER